MDGCWSPMDFTSFIERVQEVYFNLFFKINFDSDGLLQASLGCNGLFNFGLSVGFGAKVLNGGWLDV